MNQRLDLILGVVLILCPFALGLLLIGYTLGKQVAERKPEATTTAAIDGPTDEPIEVEGFTVAGKSRKPTWRQRRRELEAAARTKRKRLEEWSD